MARVFDNTNALRGAKKSGLKTIRAKLGLLNSALHVTYGLEFKAVDKLFKGLSDLDPIFLPHSIIQCMEFGGMFGQHPVVEANPFMVKAMILVYTLLEIS
ncbi:hypothetical protein C2G38_2208933 [Gigaspora rosea]|uniref:Uncharacterized protein n=1 Tax=Gigaspora rosea TaxID=44941 RepID=A0A397UPW2_9GLOM|nr:hypothetical protein C2G38_2208933 [Gigaspora rosea]